MAQNHFSAKPHITRAGTPFNDPLADVILRSCDSVDFHCHKLLLSMASAFFEGMFSLPQPHAPGGDDAMGHGLQIIPMAESASVLRTLLKLCHPSSLLNPPILELEDVVDIFQTAQKYEMEDMEKFIARNLVFPRFLDTEPARVFDIACFLHLETEAKIAAAATLAFDIEELHYSTALQLAYAEDHHCLIDYHQQCGKAAREIASDWKWLTTRN